VGGRVAFTEAWEAIDHDMIEEEEEELPSIVDIAVGNENFSILVAALTEADLVGALSGDGPFTVFAPTNAAFAALLEALEIEAADLLAHPQLADVLLYHVVGAKVMSTDLVDGMEAETLQGESLTIDLSDGVKINASTVTTADVEASNGVIHIIDTVLVPEAFSLE
ncbi:MAG: fasciclin domain-containing protein, partial [Bacillota bacterium]|nr:fasciclin domain-containing protein [Bacillota bacterium]